MKKTIKLSESQLKKMVRRIVEDTIPNMPIAQRFDPYNPEAKAYQNNLSWKEFINGRPGENFDKIVADNEKMHFETPVDGKPNSWNNMAYDELTNVRDDNGQVSMLAQDDSNPFLQRLAQAKRDSLHASRDAEFMESVMREVKKKLRNMSEAAEDSRNEVFTINAVDIQTEDSIDDMQTAVDYHSEEEAVSAARDLARRLADHDGVIMVTVMGGEYETPDGVVGEPYDIYTISTKDRMTTAAARKEAGFVRDDVDEYIENNTMDTLGEAISRALRKHLREGSQFVPEYHAPLNRFAVVTKDSKEFFDTEEEARAVFNQSDDVNVAMYCSQDGGRTWMRVR